MPGRVVVASSVMGALIRHVVTPANEPGSTFLQKEA